MKDRAEMDKQGIRLLRETRAEFCAYLDKGLQGAKALQQAAERLRRHTEELAERIDEEFQVTRTFSEAERNELKRLADQYPDLVSSSDSFNEETTTLDESLRFYHTLKSAASSEAEQTIQDLMPEKVRTEKVRWRIQSEHSPTAASVASRPQQDGYDLLRPFSDPVERTCMLLRSWEYNCGLEHLPVEMTARQALTYFRCYFGDLETTADHLGNTHALLSFRALMAKAVLREYDTYGEAKEWAIQYVEENLGSPENRRQFDIETTKHVLVKLLKKKRNVWRNKNGSRVPNKAELHRQLIRRPKSPLRKTDGEEVTRKHFGDIFSEIISTAEIDECRTACFGS